MWYNHVNLKQNLKTLYLYHILSKVVNECMCTCIKQKIHVCVFALSEIIITLWHVGLSCLPLALHSSWFILTFPVNFCLPWQTEVRGQVWHSSSEVTLACPLLNGTKPAINRMWPVSEEGCCQPIMRLLNLNIYPCTLHALLLTERCGYVSERTEILHTIMTHRRTSDRLEPDETLSFEKRRENIKDSVFIIIEVTMEKRGRLK